jgi:hypothetical protein
MLIRLSFLSSGACLGLALLAAGCSNGSHAGEFAPPALGGAGDRAAFGPAAKLGGIINTKTFSVPSGKTVTVARNLAVFASTAVTIAGTMNVPRGVSVAFFTPSFTIASTGSIVPTANVNYPGPTDDIVSACQIDVANVWEVGAGDSLGVTSSVKRNAKPGHPCTAVFAFNGNDNHSSIVMDPGVPGGSDPHRYIGQNGGWIVIGSPQAISVTQALAKKNGHPTLRAFAPDVVTIDSLLAAGNGGKGQSDDPGTFSGGGYDFNPFAGGIGGSVQISAGTIGGTTPHIAAGNGGSGGDLGLGFGDDYPYALDGSQTSPNAASATLAMASGGGGGGIFVVAKTPKTIWERAGDGGGSSMVGINGAFSAGNGWPQAGIPANAPPSGTSIGGSLTLELALPGSKGPHGNNKPSKPKNGKYSAMQFDGGWGTAWINPAALPSPAPGTAAQGGKGGSFTVVPPPHIEIDQLKGYGLSITILNYGKGGTSVIVCGAAVPGLNGGDAGALHDNGLFTYIKGLPYGFVGGQGSNGTPPGSGGTGGMNDEGKVLGAPGLAGATSC